MFVLRAFRRRRRARQRRSARAARDPRGRARLRRSRVAREAGGEAPQGGQGRQVAPRRGGGVGRRHRCARQRAPAVPQRARCAISWRSCAATSCSPPSRRSRWSTSTRRSWRTPSPCWRPCGLHSVNVVTTAVMGLCIQLEAEAAMLDEDPRAEMLEALGLGHGALDTFLRPPTRCSACGPSSPPARRRRGHGRSGRAPRRPRPPG